MNMNMNTDMKCLELVIYRLLLNVRKSLALICRVSSLLVVGRNFWTSYITVISV